MLAIGVPNLMSSCLLSTDLAALQGELLEVMPAVEEANSISEELDKRVKFEIMLVAPEIIGSKGTGKTQVMKNMVSWFNKECWILIH